MLFYDVNVMAKYGILAVCTAVVLLVMQLQTDVLNMEVEQQTGTKRYSLRPDQSQWSTDLDNFRFRASREQGRIRTSTHIVHGNYETSMLDTKVNKTDSLHIQGQNGPLSATKQGQLIRRPEEVSCDQEQRQKLLKNTCDVYRKEQEPSTLTEKYQDPNTYYHILVDDYHKVLYCEVPKVACTSWKVFLANTTGKVDVEDYPKLHELVHDTTYYPKVGFKYLNQFNNTEILFRLNNYFKFLVVRNPIARLVSAYENKLVKKSDQSRFYMETVGTYIIKKYRQNATDDSVKYGTDSELSELVKLILDKEDMYEYRFDAHWWRMQSICYPCLIHYDYIAKLETLQQDLNYLLNKIEPGTKLRFPYLNSNSGRRDQVTIDKYFNQLPSDMQENIKNFYRMDSEMFGYNVTDNAAECR